MLEFLKKLKTYLQIETVKELNNSTLLLRPGRGESGARTTTSCQRLRVGAGRQEHFQKQTKRRDPFQWPNTCFWASSPDKRWHQAFFSVSTAYFSQEQTILHNVRWAECSDSNRSTFKEPCAVSSAEIWKEGQPLGPGPTGKAERKYLKNSKEETWRTKGVGKALQADPRSTSQGT